MEQHQLTYIAHTQLIVTGNATASKQLNSKCIEECYSCNSVLYAAACSLQPEPPHTLCWRRCLTVLQQQLLRLQLGLLCESDIIYALLHCWCLAAGAG